MHETSGSVARPARDHPRARHALQPQQGRVDSQRVRHRPQTRAVAEADIVHSEVEVNGSAMTLFAPSTHISSSQFGPGRCATRLNSSNSSDAPVSERGCLEHKLRAVKAGQAHAAPHTEPVRTRAAGSSRPEQ